MFGWFLSIYVCIRQAYIACGVIGCLSLKVYFWFWQTKAIINPTAAMYCITMTTVQIVFIGIWETTLDFNWVGFVKTLLRTGKKKKVMLGRYLDFTCLFYSKWWASWDQLSIRRCYKCKCYKLVKWFYSPPIMKLRLAFAHLLISQVVK